MKCRMALLVAFWLAVPLTAARADDAAGSLAVHRLYHLNASAPDQALSDTVYRYLSEQAAGAYSNKRYKDAERLYSTALDDAGRRHAKPAEIAVLATNLASVYRDDRKFDQAKPLFERALAAAGEKACGIDSVYQYVLRQYAVYLSRTGKNEEANFTAEAAREGHKLLSKPNKLKAQYQLFSGPILPVLSVHPEPPFVLPVRDPNDPFMDVTRPLPPVAGHMFQITFAECPPRERWTVFDNEKQNALNHQWAEWLQKFREAINDGLNDATDTPKDARFHLVIGRSGHIDDVEVLSNPAEQEEFLQWMSGTIARVNTGKNVPFPEDSQMDEIHVVVNFHNPTQKKEEIDWSEFKPQVSNGWSVIYPISGGRWSLYGQPAAAPRARVASAPAGSANAGKQATGHQSSINSQNEFIQALEAQSKAATSSRSHSKK